MTKEERLERIETLKDMLDETSVEWGNPALIRELKELEKGVKLEL